MGAKNDIRRIREQMRIGREKQIIRIGQKYALGEPAKFPARYLPPRTVSVGLRPAA